MGASVLIIGHLGSIGNRWRLACTSLGHEVSLWDVASKVDPPPLDGITHAIIATPTPTHSDTVRWAINRYRCQHVLCEKPLCTDYEEAMRLGRSCESTGVDLRCVNNWEYPTDDMRLMHRSHQIDYSSPTFGREDPWCNLCQPVYYSYHLTAKTSDIWSLTIDNTLIPYDTWQWCYRRLLQRWVVGEPTMTWHEGCQMITEAQAWTASQ